MRRLALFFAACAFIFAGSTTSPVFAQDGDVPSLSNDDVQSPVFSSSSSASGAVGSASSILGSLGKSSSVAPAALQPLIAKFNAGETISCAVRFEIDANGKAHDVVLERGTGVPAIDREIVRALREAPARPMSSTDGIPTDLSRYRMEAAVSKARLRFDFSANAPSAARAVEIKEQGQAQFMFLAAMFAQDPDMAALGRGINLTQVGQRVGLSVDLDMALLERIAMKQQRPTN